MIKNYAILIIKYTVVVLLFSLIVELVRIPINIIFSKDALFVTAINIGLTEVMKIILTIYLYKWLMKKTDTNVVPKSTMSRRWIRQMLFIILAYLLIYKNTVGALIESLSLPSFVVDEVSGYSDIETTKLMISAIFSGPLREELTIRGFVLNRLLSKYPYKVSIVLSALVFGLSHFNIEQGVNAFFIGCLLGYIYYRTGSLLTSIILHSLINLYLISSVAVKFMSQVPPLYFQIGEVAVGFVILVVLVRGYRRGKLTSQLHKNDGCI